MTPVAARRAPVPTIALLLAAFAASPATAQDADPSRLTVERIFGSTEFTPQSFGPSKWLGDGAAYTTLEAPPNAGAGREIVRHDTRTGARSVLVSVAHLTPAGVSEPLTVADYAWTEDQNRLLIFTNTRQVWRVHSRGDYWVLDRPTGRLHKLGGQAAGEASLMFAKFSPDGRRVGYVRENNIYVEHLESGAIVQVTDDGSRTTINGTFDWVYEEELGLRDGWRWSPDGTWIAYWQLDATGVRDFNLIRNNDSLYSQVVPIQYPKAGEQNSAARIGVVLSAGGTTTWLNFQGDPREHYPARMDWAANSREVIVQRLNRLQNTLEVVLGDIRTGALTPLFVERDSAWVYHVDDLVWLNGGQEFTWMSERNGWSKVYVASRDGGQIRLVTPGAFDVLGVQAIDAHGGWVYYIASPSVPSQRYLYRSRLDGRGQPERLTPANQTGTNVYNVSPDGRAAIHTHSRFGVPPVINLVSLPDHRVLRTLVDNAALHAAVARLDRGPWEFTTVDIGDGVELEAWVMKPVGFDPARRHPILFHVYGGPGSQRVLDRWDGAGWLWHLMLAQQGYVVATIDNRGTGARGREWRKIVYGQLGVIETEDQIAAARVVAQLPWVDESRMGIWGWSYGGFMSLNGLFQGSDVYAAAISVAPVTHWRFYDTIYTERYNGLPQLNPSGYDAGSPLTHVAGMRGKLLLIHGTGDDNVHHQNTEALVNALVAGNKQFTMMAYPDRNHSISGGSTSVHLRTLMTEFLDTHLKGAAVTMTP